MVKAVLQLLFISITCCYGHGGTSDVVHQCYMLLWSRRYFSCCSSVLHAVMVKAILMLLYIRVTCCYGHGGTSVVVHQCYLLLWSWWYFSCCSSVLHAVMVKAVLQLLFINLTVRVQTILPFRFISVTCCYGHGGTSVVVH